MVGSGEEHPARQAPPPADRPRGPSSPARLRMNERYVPMRIRVPACSPSFSCVFRPLGTALAPLLALLLLLAALRPALAAGTVTVTTTNDVVDGTTTSVAALQGSPGPDGKISLREAVQAVNNDPGGPWTISLP